MALFTFCRSRFCKSSNSYARLLSSLQRPVASLDKRIEEDADSEASKFQFKNPGATSRGIVRLPVDLRRAIDKLIAGQSPAVLLREAQKLRNHLNFKKPPLSQEEVTNIRAQAEDKLNSEKPPPDTTYLTQEDVDRIRNSRNSILNKMTEQKAYRWKPVTYDKPTALTYLVARLASDYATLTHVFNEIHLRDPDFQPSTMFDFGSGIGTATWAARCCWGNQLFKEIFCVDSSIAMNSIALALLQGGVLPQESDLMEDEFRADVHSHNSLLKGLFFRQYLPSSSAIKYDLVVSAHSLLELPSTELRLQTALSLWRKSQGYLVFVEHGSRAAFEVIAEIRDFLLKISNKERHAGLEGHVFAPCPHEHECPRLADFTPCNFEVTYEPLFVSRNDKFMKERYSYLVLKKGPKARDEPQWPRIVRPILVRSGHTVCRLCTSEGTLDEVVITRSKHSKQTNRCAKYSQWGDRLPVALSWNSNEPESNETVQDDQDKT